jgi:2-haloacid dehalogenase
MSEPFNRRQLLKFSLFTAVIANLPHIGLANSETEGNKEVKALVFDVFGTVVDWRASIIDEGQQLNESKKLAIDWAQFADDWRAGYGPYMLKVRDGKLPWTTIDNLHRMMLDELGGKYDLSSFSDSELDHLNQVWHRLQPWPDAVSGLSRLKTKFMISTLSNGNVSLLANMAKNSGLPWDVVLSAELFKTYKPDLVVYQSAAEILGLVPSQVMMVAAHVSDLNAAQEAGLKTAYIHRPLERGPGKDGKGQRQAAARLSNFNFVAEDFHDLANQLDVQ